MISKIKVNKIVTRNNNNNNSSWKTHTDLWMEFTVVKWQDIDPNINNKIVTNNLVQLKHMLIDQISTIKIINCLIIEIKSCNNVTRIRWIINSKKTTDENDIMQLKIDNW